MSKEYTGFVHKVHKKSGTGKRGDWFLETFQLASPDGDIDENYFQLGFDKALPFKEGEYISFQADPVEGYDRSKMLVAGTGKVHNNAPARSQPEEKGKGKGKGGGWGGGPKEKDTADWGKIGGYNTENDVARISWAAARNSAIDFLKVLLDNDAVVISSAKTKAGQAKRYDEVMAVVDKITVKFYHDSKYPLRQLELVDDSGTVDTEADTDLPDNDDSPEPEAQADGPPPEDEGSDGRSF